MREGDELVCVKPVGRHIEVRVTRCRAFEAWTGLCLRQIGDFFQKEFEVLKSVQQRPGTGGSERLFCASAVSGRFRWES